MERPSAVRVPVSDCLPYYRFAVRPGCGEDRQELSAVGGGQRAQEILVDVDLDMLPVVAVSLGEHHEDLAEVGRWPVPCRRETVLGVWVEYDVCRWPGMVVPDQQRFPVQGHVRPGHLELFLDVVYGFPPPAGEAAQPVIHCMLLDRAGRWHQVPRNQTRPASSAASIRPPTKTVADGSCIAANLPPLRSACFYPSSSIGADPWRVGAGSRFGEADRMRRPRTDLDAASGSGTMNRQGRRHRPAPAVRPNEPGRSAAS